MKTRYLILLLILGGFITSCRNGSIYSNFTGFAQGTTYKIVFENPLKKNADELKEEVEKILTDFDMSLSLYRDSSILSRINRNEETEPDSFFTGVFIKSKEMSQLTQGTFDVTVGPLVKAWGFGPDSRKNFSESKRDSLLQLVGIEKVDMINGRVVKSDPRVSLDFNAIAQGYSVDVIYNYLKAMGFKSFLVEIGGEIRVRGDKGGAMWKVGIDRPFDNNMNPGADMQAIIRLKEQALATSGNYRKFYIEDGIKYSHTIDPKTGYPAKNQLLSVTIIASDCASADAIATGCMVMGKDKTIEFLEQHPDFKGYLIYSGETGEFKTWKSKNLRKYISE
jgi:thiamine biosynthesis lipoprotein